MWPSIQVKTTSAQYTYVHINTQKLNTISKIMIANPTNHSLSTQWAAHGSIVEASQAPRTQFRQACGGNQCPNYMPLYPDPWGGAKAGSRCGLEQRLFKKSFHMAATKWIKQENTQTTVDLKNYTVDSRYLEFQGTLKYFEISVLQHIRFAEWRKK